jgi:hypothetical protein
LFTTGARHCNWYGLSVAPDIYARWSTVPTLTKEL